MIRPDYPGDDERPPVNPSDPRDHCWDVYGDWSFVISDGYHNYSIYHSYVPGQTRWEDTLSDLAGRPKHLHLVRLSRVRDGYEYWLKGTVKYLDLVGGAVDVSSNYLRCFWISDETMKRIISLLPVVAKLSE